MSDFEFHSDHGELQFGLADWHFVIELAERYDWRPAGAVFPGPAPDLIFLITRGEEFEELTDDEVYEERLLRDYFSNSGQRLTDEDASDLAAALEMALPDIPDHDARGGKRKEDALPRRVAAWWRIMPGDRPMPSRLAAINALEWFSGPEKQRLLDFTQFCRAGGFSVH